MSTLTITRGLPGSGKSTWAREQTGAVRVNRDDLRAMLGPWPWPHGDRTAEDLCTAVQHAAIRAAIDAGHDVICDDTNLHPGHLAQLVALAEWVGATAVIHDMTDVPLEKCIKQDSQRPAAQRVGETVIRDMHDRHIANR